MNSEIHIIKMDQIEENLKSLLNGGGLPSNNLFCDFTISDQSEVLASKGVTPTGPTEFIPLTKKTVTYIVAAVIINEKDEVLMMQEAKPSCNGSWYLPAGRVEPGETIKEAVIREVKEECGFTIEPTTLIMVESATGSWFRFVFAGRVIGGRLKTSAEADKESLQAKWVKNIDELTLRAKDILPLIERGYEYSKYKSKKEANPEFMWHKEIMPASVGHVKMLMRFIIIVRRKSNNKVNVLVSEKNNVHLPLCEIHPQKSLHSVIKKYMNEIFGAELPSHRPHGVYSIEINGKPAEEKHDGMCLNIVVSVRQALEEVLLIDKYSWREIQSASLAEELIRRLGKNLSIPLHVIR